MISVYPNSAEERTNWIVARRGERNLVQPDRPYAFLLEQERTVSGELADVATIFLTNRECPWKCVMCDLWRNTTQKGVLPGAIPEQMRFALSQLSAPTVLKLYNSGSFFDEGAIRKVDWAEIAKLCRGVRHLIVECHPRLVTAKVVEFQSMLPCSLEIALGLETVHSGALEALNKRVTINDYRRAAEFLRNNRIAVRTFLLVHPPFVPKTEQDEFLRRSIEFAFDCGSDVVSLIPLRAGNGAIDELIRQGKAKEPSLADVEKGHRFGLALNRNRVFADTWDLARFSDCGQCDRERIERIQRMNLSQRIEPPIPCPACGNA